MGLAAVAAAFLVAALLTGEALYVIPVALAAALWLAYFFANRTLGRKAVERSGGAQAAMADHTNPIPSAHLIADDETPLGDTTEAHDEITAHDLPKGHPGRPAAERLAHRGGGTTRGHADPSEVRDPATPGDEAAGPDRAATVPEAA